MLKIILISLQFTGQEIVQIIQQREGRQGDHTTQMKCFIH